MGFDDIELVSHLTPALTTSRQPHGQIGETPSVGDIVLPVDMIERDSKLGPLS